MNETGQESRVVFKEIGLIHTPYHEHAPFQPVSGKVEKDAFSISLHEAYREGLMELQQFKYIYVLFFADRITRKPVMRVTPPWAGGVEVGLFASRSPVRPNPIGLSIVRIEKIVDGTIYTSGLDVFDGTPLLDIKPYIKDLDDKPDANTGWIEELDHSEHLALHIRGIPHEH